MKKILSEKFPERRVTLLRSKLRELVLAHDAEIAVLDGEVQIREAWALTESRVKVRGQVRLRDGGFHAFTCTVPFALPPERCLTHRDWTIAIKPTWYGFRYELSDEEGRSVSETAEDIGSSAFAEENAKRDINRLIAEREKRQEPHRRPSA